MHNLVVCSGQRQYTNPRNINKIEFNLNWRQKKANQSVTPMALFSSIAFLFPIRFIKRSAVSLCSLRSRNIIDSKEEEKKKKKKQNCKSISFECKLWLREWWWEKWVFLFPTAIAIGRQQTYVANNRSMFFSHIFLGNVKEFGHSE